MSDLHSARRPPLRHGQRRWRWPPITHLSCIEATTGKRVWQKAHFGKGNLIAVDGKLIITTMRGELVMVRATSKAFEELARAKVFQGSRAALTLANGRLYLRDAREILCLNLRE